MQERETASTRLTTDGYFAEYVLVDYQNAIILPKNLIIERAAPLFCAGINAFHSVDSCDLKPGQWLAVTGCSGSGQLATQYAKAFGFQVIWLDISDTNLAVTKEQGADHVLNTITDKEYVQKVKDFTSGGVHAAAVFSNADAAYASGPSIICLGGTLMVVGIPKKTLLQISTIALVNGLFNIKAESTSIPQRMGKAIAFTAEHNIQPMVQIRELENIGDMVAEMRAGKATTRMGGFFFFDETHKRDRKLHEDT